MSNEALDAPTRLRQLLRDAEVRGASDIHLQRIGRGASVAFRLDGVLAPVPAVPEELADRLFGRIKFLASLKTYEESLPQDGRIDATEAGTTNDVRVATYPTVTGEKIVLRLFQASAGQGLTELGFSQRLTEELKQVLGLTTGLLLLTGPAGSGKTTTIYACLRNLLAAGGRHIITIEDPAEQVLPGLMQTEVNEARGLTFAVAARHLLRQDPQVLVVGEIRDEETANLALRAALTGHLVISTLHAGSCRGVLERLLVMGRDPYAVLSALQLVLNQRLVRRLCPGCQGRGCPDCCRSGYRGRLPLVEWVRLDDAMRRQLRPVGPDALVLNGTFAESVRELLAAGLSNLKEVERVLGLEGGWRSSNDSAEPDTRASV